MSLVDQATGTYKCDGCGKTIDVYETHLWGDPTGWSEYCIKCHTDMCRQRSAAAYRCATCDKELSSFWDGVDYMGKKYCDDTCKDKSLPFTLSTEELKKLAERMLANDDIEYICDGEDRLLCKNCPVDKASDETGECTDPLRKEWARGYLQPTLREQYGKEGQDMFELKTRGGYEYVIYKTYSEDEVCGGYSIHGAIKYGVSWSTRTWKRTGEVGLSEHPHDLLPIKPKKRRFKTAEELVANQYSSTEFRCDGRITVRNMGYVHTRITSDTPEGNYSEEWLNVFTTIQDEEN